MDALLGAADDLSDCGDGMTGLQKSIIDYDRRGALPRVLLDELQLSAVLVVHHGVRNLHNDIGRISHQGPHLLRVDAVGREHERPPLRGTWSEVHLKVFVCGQKRRHRNEILRVSRIAV